MIESKFISVVIPVFNSANIIEETVKRTCGHFNSINIKYEVILVNDGSSDSSWTVISGLAKDIQQVRAINLLRNYGQHTANLCGFKAAKGDYVITMDDDLQNPPEEIKKFITAMDEDEDCDLIIGEFKEKKHSLIRRIGSKVIGSLNRRVFYVKENLVLSNFRMIRRDVVDRVCEYKSSAPYIPGLVLMFSSVRKNVLVEHFPRREGASNYSMYRIMRLVFTVLFNYSSLPLRLMAGFGFFVAAFSFLLSLYYLFNALVSGIAVPGWATLVILLSFFNGVLILIISVVGEYVVRLLRENNSEISYHVKDVVE